MAVGRCRAKRRILRLKPHPPPRSLTDAIAPLLALSRLTGLRAFERPRGRPRFPLNLVYLALLLGAYYNSTYVQQKFYSEIKLLRLEYLLYRSLTGLNTVAVSCQLLLSRYYAKRLVACHRKIYEIDETLRWLRSTVDYGGLRVATCRGIIFFASLILVTAGMQMYFVRIYTSLYTTICLTVPYVLGISVSATVVCEFLIYVKCLQAKFESINQLLSEGTTISSAKETEFDIFAERDYSKIMGVRKRMRISSVEKLSPLFRQPRSRKRLSVLEKPNPLKSHVQSHSQSPKRSQRDLQRQPRDRVVITEHQRLMHLLQTIKQVHLELCGVSRILCTAFGVQIYLEVGTSVMFVTGILYNLYIRLIQQDNVIGSDMKHLLWKLVIGISYASKIVCLCRVCRNATNEGNKTAEIIHGLYGHRVDADEREEIRQFGLQTLLSPVTFRALGFALNYRALTSFLRTITTYLVITLQMSISLESSRGA